jgi:hypothetical protein
MSEDKIRGWIQAVSSILTAIGIFLGFLRYARDSLRKNSVEEFGTIALEIRKMGYFVIPEPNVMWLFAIWTRRITKPPVLPTLSTILKAGETQHFTSAMFDWINVPSGGDIVSWKGLFEAFFDELAWSRPRYI